MIKNIKNKTVLMLCLVIVILLSAVLGFILSDKKSAFATEISFVDGEISAEYSLGSTFTPPQAKITYNGQTYDAQLQSITYPNNRSYSDQAFVLSVPGKYTLNYIATAGSEKLIEKVEFLVSGNAYEVSGNNSSVQYSCVEKTNALGEILTDGEAKKVEGLKVSLAPGDVFTYKTPIDFKGKTKYDNILSLYAVPQIMGKADARILHVRITDAYDAENYIDVVTYGNYGDEDEVRKWALYSGAGASNQPLTGIHFYAAKNERTFNYQGQLYTLNKNIAYNSANGYPSFAFSLSAANGYLTPITGLNSGAYTLAMDYAEKQLFGCSTIAPSSNGMICDLDEQMFFDTLWKGFKTGEAYISIWAENYVNSSFTFIIDNIAGYDLTKTDYLDEGKPIIEIETPQAGVPSAIVGNEYKIFSSVATDAVDGKLNQTITVYRNYASSNPVSVNVVGGVFVPDKAGIYTILYTAIDRSGNSVSEQIEVVAKEQSSLKITLSESEKSGLAGEKIMLANPTVSDPDGKYTLDVSVTIDNTTVEIIPESDGNYYFTPMSSGTYTVKYVCEDYNVQKIEQYSLSIANNPVPVFTEVVKNLPPVFVKSVEYVLPEVNGYDFSDGTAKEKIATVSYAFDGGEFIPYDKGSKLKITASEKVEIKYSLGADEKSNRSYEVPVTEVFGNDGAVIRSKYFYGKDFNLTTLSDSVDYYTSAENAQLVFVNKLLMTEFSFKFAFKELNANEIVFKFFDSQDNTNGFSVSFREKDKDSCYISINKKEAQSVSLVLKNTGYDFSYDFNENVIKLGGITFAVEDFNGFISKTAYFAIDILDNTAVTSISISEINGQKIDSSTEDNAGPRYYMDINVDQKHVGDKLVISELIVLDVLKFATSVEITVIHQDGTVCVSDDGVSMSKVKDFSREYSITLNKIGEYTVYGKCSDGKRTTNINKIVEVTDDIAPELTLGGHTTSFEVGQTVTVADCSALDTTDSDLTISISVQRPDLKVVALDGNTFVADQKGIYTIMYMVFDEAGNLAFTSYEITVFEETTK